MFSYSYNAPLLASQASRNSAAALSPSPASFTLCSRKPLKSVQKASVPNTSFPLAPTAALGNCSSNLPGPPVPTLAAPPITIIPNSTSVSSSPRSSSTTLASPTGFRRCKILILSTGMFACADTSVFRSRTERRGDCCLRATSMGGLREERKVIDTVRWAPGASFLRLGRVLGSFGRMYYNY